MGLSEVAKMCSISAKSCRSLQEPDWDWLTFWNVLLLACTAMPVISTASLSTQMLWQASASCVATAWHNDWCYKAIASGLDFFCLFCTSSLFFAVAAEHDKQYRSIIFFSGKDFKLFRWLGKKLCSVAVYQMRILSYPAHFLLDILQLTENYALIIFPPWNSSP